MGAGHMKPAKYASFYVPRARLLFIDRPSAKVSAVQIQEVTIIII
jgi:hypothetical protein